MHRISFLLILFIAAQTLFAQEVFLSISGTNANAKITGDELHQYDYWIRPDAGAKHAVLNVFDASLGGIADIVLGKAETSTQFAFYPFEMVYDLSDGRLLKKKSNAGPSAAVTVLDEPQYRNRWAPFFPLTTSSQGWILRVTAGKGDDINTFQITVSDSGGNVTSRPDWKVIAIDLSVCLYRVAPNAEMQILPFITSTATIPAMRSYGEEIAGVVIRDAFGESTPLPAKENFYTPTLANGMKNSWGMIIKGSSDWVNNVVVRGINLPVLWEFKPVIVRQPVKPLISAKQLPGQKCEEIVLTLTEGTRKEIGDVVPNWSYRSQVFEKDSVAINFERSGDFEVHAFIPTRGISLPRYWKEKIPVHVNAPPKAVITTDKQVASPGEIITLSGTSSFDPERAPLKFAWYVNGEYRSNEPTLTVSSLLPTTYEVRLTVSDGAVNSSCSESSVLQRIRINAQPYVDIAYRPVFGRGAAVPFSVKEQLDNDGDPLFFTWKGDGIEGQRDGATVTVRHTKAGRYSIAVTASDRSNTANQEYSTSIVYHVNAEPVPKFQLIPLAAPGDVIPLISESSDEDNAQIAVEWRSSDGQTFTAERTSITFQQPGEYTITLIANDGENVENSVQQISKKIRINAPPVPKITAEHHSTSARQVISAELSSDADNTALSYAWDFGDGSKGTGKKATHVYQSSGTYMITLTVNDNQKQSNSIQTAAHQIVINKYPVADFTLPKNWEPGTPLSVSGKKSYDSDGEITEYIWLVNGKEVATGSDASLTFDAPGDYAVALRVKDNSGFEDAVGVSSLPIHINYPPVVRWKMIPEIAEPNVPVIFDATASSDDETKTLKNILWKFSDGSSVSGPKFTKSFVKPGLLNVTITVDDDSRFGNSRVSQDGSILVNSSPIIVTKTVIRTNSRRVLLDASKSYDVDKQALSFTWLMPDGSRVNKASFTWDAPAGGVHFLSLSANDGQGKSNSVSREGVQVLVNRPPVAVVDTLIYSCTGQTILFNGSLSFDPDGDAISTRWDFGDGSASTETNPAHVYRTPGYYTVQLLLDDGFAEQPTIATIPIIIEGSPIAVQRFTDTTICVNVPLNFDGSMSNDPNGPIGSYSWDFGDGISSLGDKVSHAYTRAGTYYATLTVVGSGSGRCSKVSQATATIRVIEGPTAQFTMPERVSIGQTVLFDPSLSRPNGTVSFVRWKFGMDSAVTASSLQPIQFRFDRPGTYEIELFLQIRSESNCNSASIVKKIQVNDPPQLVCEIPSDVALGDPLVLDASRSKDRDGIIASYEWVIDGKRFGSTPVVSVSSLKAGMHTIALMITDNSMTSSASATKEFKVRVNAKPSPSFTLPESVYENELVYLLPASKFDEDGDTLTFQWKVNNSIIPVDSIRLSGGRNVITLVANDRRNLKNSIDSVQREIFVTPAPDFSITYPKDWIVRTEIDIQKIFNAQDIFAYVNYTPYTSWKPNSPGEQSVPIVWMPKGKPLASSTFTVTVWESLKFIERPEPQTMEWNPSNPKIVLTAPQMNRPASANIQYEWRKGKTSLGFGKVIEAPLTQGRNIFFVRATDQGINGANTTEIDIVVICE